METYLTKIYNYLLTQSWQIAILVVVIAVVSWLLRNKSAHVRYLLWLLVLAKCFVPPLLTIPLAILPEEEPAITIYRNSIESAEPVELSPMIVPSLPIRSAPPINTVEEQPVRLTMHQWLAVVWIFGVIIFALIALIKALRTELWIRRERKPLPAISQVRIEDAFSELNLKKFPKIWLIDGIGQPFVWGLLRGAIYLPSGFLSVNNVEQQKGIFGHELSHILRYDAAVNFVQVVVQGIFWFHPFVWWANKKIRSEREKCCDETAIARLGVKIKDYSTAIVNTLVIEHKSTRPVPSLAIAGPVKNIEERIKIMLKPGKKFYKRPSVIAIIILLLVAIFTIPIGCALTSRSGAETATEQEGAHYETLFEAVEAGDLAEVKRFIDEGADINIFNRVGQTPLHVACEQGNKEVAELLIDKGADVNAKTDSLRPLSRFFSGFTPLHFAVQSGNKEIIELLISKGADINVKDNTDLTPLSLAKQEGDNDIAELLREHGAEDEDPEINNSLHQAVEDSDIERVKQLISEGANVNAKNSLGSTPLHFGAGGLSGGRGGWIGSLIGNVYINIDVAKLLLDNGADVNAKNNLGQTPLQVACQADNKEFAELLIGKGADVNAKNNATQTPLHLACVNGYKEIAELLIDKGADVNAKNNATQTPLHLACVYGKIEIANVLIDNGADVNASNNAGLTPLDLAERNGYTEIVELLKQHGATEEADASPEPESSMSLHEAVESDNIELVKQLISSGADVNAKNDSGQTPLDIIINRGQFQISRYPNHAEIRDILLTNGAEILSIHAAVKSADLEKVRAFLEQGIDIDSRDADGDTPLFIAVQDNNNDLVRLLLDAGADINAENNMGQTSLDTAQERAQILGQTEIFELLKSKVEIQSIYLAAQLGNLEKVKEFLQQGIDINSKDENGQTALHIAVNNDKKEIVKFLIDEGADVNTKDDDGHTPLDIILNRPSYMVSRSPNQAEISEMLLTNGAEIMSIHQAVQLGDIEKVKEFLAQGTDINANNLLEYSPLYLAASGGHLQIVELLLSEEADINENSQDVLTSPLYGAIVEGHIDVLKLLLDNGADVNVSLGTRRGGITILNIAQQLGNAEIVELLREHGAEE